MKPVQGAFSWERPDQDLVLFHSGIKEASSMGGEQSKRRNFRPGYQIAPMKMCC
jgi:hypothetical protein